MNNIVNWIKEHKMASALIGVALLYVIYLIFSRPSAKASALSTPVNKLSDAEIIDALITKLPTLSNAEASVILKATRCMVSNGTVVGDSAMSDILKSKMGDVADAASIALMCGLSPSELASLNTALPKFTNA